MGGGDPRRATRESIIGCLTRPYFDKYKSDNKMKRKEPGLDFELLGLEMGALTTNLLLARVELSSSQTYICLMMIG